MIWTRGAIMAEESLRISVLDRTFEHGLGLFETLRTWGGHPTLLPRHLDRMRRSAEALGIPIDNRDLPGAAAVADLLGACHAEGADAAIRITATGGRPGSFAATVWMRAAPLPVHMPTSFKVDEAVQLLGHGDRLAAHKTLNYWSRRIAHEGAVAEGADERLVATPDGSIWEGTRSNVFLIRNGRLVTPTTDGPMLAGIMRGVVIERARSLGLEVEERPVDRVDLACAEEAFLTNSLRGIVPIGSLIGRPLPAPGLVTSRLQEGTLRWLTSGGVES